MTIPGSVKRIGDFAFEGCTALTTVTISDGVESISQGAFKGCRSLTEISVDGNNASYCSVDGIVFNKDRTKLIVFPAGIEGAYSIPEGVTAIGTYAFYGCSGLTSVTLPKSLKSVEWRAFDGCTGLERVEISDFAAWCEINFNGVSNRSANPLYYARHLYVNGEELTELTIPEGVTKLPGYLFSCFTAMTSITIPESLTSIGMYAFENCTGLERVEISDLAAWCRIEFGTEGNPLWFAHHLYLNGTEIKELRVPEGVTSIEGGVFSGCSSIKTATFPYSLTSIKGGFWGCTGLTSVFIPSGVTSIEEGSFYGCSSLTNVYFGGSEAEWNSIIEDGNEDFAGVTIHFNAVISSEPGPIANVTVTPFSGGKISLSWSASAGAKTYVLQRHERGSDVWTTLSGSISGTSYVDTSGDAGKIYQYRVRGRDGDSFGPYRTSAEVACMSGSEPGSVGTPTVKPASGGKITVSWKAAEGAATYILQRNERGSATWTTLASNLKETKYTDSGAKLGKVYRYRVCSRNVSVFGPFKVSAEVAAMKNSAPGAVSNVTVTAAAKKITVSWGAAEGAASYIVQRKERGSDTWTTLNSNVKETRFVDTTGTVGKVYQYRVRSRNVSTYGPFKASTEAGFMSGSTPGDIKTVTVKATSGRITVTWTASSGAAGYIVQRRVKGGSWENLSTNVTELKYVDKDVKAGTAYQYRIRPRNGSIYGSFKAGAEVTAQ